MHSIVGSKSSFVEHQHFNEVVLQGYHKKLKTMKKKYFVLCAETPSRAARLEYYDSEKKFKQRSNPKKTIILKNCFNINRRLDTKYKHVIALSVRDGGFCIVFDSEEELNKWLKSLLTLQRGEETEADMPKPTFEHVWQVQVQRKGLAEEKGLLGSYHVCLTSRSLTLYRIGSPKTYQGECRMYSVEFDLTTIRRCGDLSGQCYFYMEVGRHSAIGAGELWMETEDTLIAQNMHTMILNSMSSMRGREDPLGPMRKRSSSETSKPTSGIQQRRQTNTGIKPVNSSPQTNSTLGRDRCDSLPSRNRTISECSNQSITNPSMPPPKTIPINRPHSMYTNRHSHSPPVTAISPSTGCSESEGSSLSIDEPDSLDHSSLTPDESGNFVSYFNPLSSRITIPEEKDEMWYPDNKITSSDTEIPFIDKLNNLGGLSLPLSTHQLGRKGSPAMNSHTGSIDMQTQYMDMTSPYSPCGSSPCDQIGGGYIPISPSVDCNRGLYTGSSGGHSRASSLAEETVDGYVPMCPPNQPPTLEYVDMEQSIKHNTNNRSGFSSAASSSSITSGTPSTDLKFCEYPLEKQTSRFTPDDEDMQSVSDRPARAYSVGSRVEHNKRKLRVHDFNNELQNNSRVRAFSVGSRAKVPRCDLSRGVLQSNLLANHINAANSNLNNNNELNFNTSSKQRNSKSSSAPLLLHKTHSSVERMSDLMEIDFSKNSADSSSSSGSRRNLDMSSSFLTQSTKASRISSIPITVPFSSTTKSNSYSKATPPGGYLEMRSGSFPDNNCFSSSSPLSLSKFENTGGGSSNSINNGNCGYLEMKPVYISNSPSLSSSPLKSMLSPKFSAKPQLQETQNHPVSAKEYTSMSINKSNNNKTTTDMQNEYINVSPASAEFTNISTIKENEKSIDIDQFPIMPEGYVPMNSNRNNGDIIPDMSSNEFWINRSASMPIDIKNANQPNHKYPVDLDTSAIITGQHDIHSQHSNDGGGISESALCNQNTMFSLSPCSPQKSFDINQINNSNTIINNSSNAIERKCLVDASNGTVTLLDNRQEKPKINNDKPGNSLSTLSSLQKLHISNTNSNNKLNFYKDNNNSNKNVESFLCNYTDMSLNICEKQKNNSNEFKKDRNAATFTTERSNTEPHDYVNYHPTNLKLKLREQKTTTDNINNSSSNIVGSGSNYSNNSGNILKIDKLISYISGSSSTKKFPIRDKSSIGIFEGFKPINDEMNNNNNSNTNTNYSNNNINNNNNVLKKSPRTTTITTTTTNASKNNPNISSYGTYELLRCDSNLIQQQQQQIQQQNKFSLSRPSSVNSDKISPLKNTTTICGQIRPNSANSEFIPSPISNSSSTSTLCGGSSSTSSSSTLCGSKSQSPLASSSSRPQSFTDCTAFDIMRADSNSSADTLSSSTTITTIIPTANNIVGGINNSSNSNILLTSRPPSVVSEKELHYASLDLPPNQSSTTATIITQQQQNPTTQSASSSSIPETKVNSSTSGDSSTSPSPNASCCQQQPAFTYAQIDFKKSNNIGGSSNESGGNNIGINIIKTDQNSNNN